MTIVKLPKTLRVGAVGAAPLPARPRFPSDLPTMQGMAGVVPRTQEAPATTPDADAHTPPRAVPTSADAAAKPPTPAVALPGPGFREEARVAYGMGNELAAPLEVVSPRARLLLGTLGVTVLAVLAISAFGHVDLNASGRGVLRSATGVQPLMFETEGVVRDVLVHDGDLVEQGQVLARLDSTRLRVSLQESEELLRALEERTRLDGLHAEEAQRRDVGLLDQRAVLLRARIDSQNKSLAALSQTLVRYRQLAQQGLVSRQMLRDTEALLDQERRSLLALRDELARLEQQLTEREQSHRDGVSQRAQEVRDAVSRRDAAKMLLAQTELRAARAGRVESLLASPGDVIGAGHPVARLVSQTGGQYVTAFLPERDRAFVQTGASVRVEFDQLPVGEFGSAQARVQRISSDVADRAELERALGAAAPAGVHFAAVMEMQDEPRSRSLLSRVSSGAQVTVRLPVRRRRIISLVFDPVRSWLDN